MLVVVVWWLRTLTLWMELIKRDVGGKNGVMWCDRPVTDL